MSTPAVSGRERLAQMREHESKSKRRKTLIGVAAAILILALVVGVAMWAVVHRHNKTAAATQKTISEATHVPDSVYNAVGAGTATSDFTAMTSPANPPQTKDGKPLVTYYGAEFCPYCAMDRWALTAALSRFGTFTGLGPQTSSSDEGPQLSNLQTLTFRNAKYTSPYLALTTYEMTDRDHNPLQTPPAEAMTFFKTNKPTQGIPWVSWQGEASSGVEYNGLLIGGKSGQEIADAMNDPKSLLGQGIIGSANLQSAYICTLTHNKPATVCNSAGVKAAAKKLSVAKAGS